ncbi:MAG TPA: DUF2802 domain-containing protein [Alteromonas australica]|uniref:DUF2802 domain-containing protein n=2 Tax=Alteromonas australica TaxID=589873 RepID=A0A358DY99_9ALTE|nr:DUF2802 domain-containing protein [Alteromonas australica]HAW76508.1 DUF2802 domain-containing protein [Alteromonas australica]HBU51259.1 DUF2802 domain-containing protein [Alteromonas australica]
MEMQFIAPTLYESILLVLVVVLSLLIVWLFKQIRSLQQGIKSLEAKYDSRLEETVSSVRNFAHQQNEEQARNLVVTRHIQALQGKFDDLENQLREVKLQDPSLRLYQRAAELVKQGASIEEIMEACDIPRAEAEMLSMVHRQPAGS